MIIKYLPNLINYAGQNVVTKPAICVRLDC